MDLGRTNFYENYKLDNLNRDYITTEKIFVPKSSFKVENGWRYAQLNINTKGIISFVMNEMTGWGEFATIIEDNFIEIGVCHSGPADTDISFTIVRLNSI